VQRLFFTVVTIAATLWGIVKAVFFPYASRSFRKRALKINRKCEMIPSDGEVVLINVT